MSRRPRTPHDQPGSSAWWRGLVTERPRPRALARDPHAWRLVVATVCIGAFMGQLDASIVTVALPTIRSTFSSSLGAVQWVALSYLLVLVATVTAAGRLSDMVGRKLLYLYGFGVFTIGSLLCGLAPSLLWLDAFRVLQAVGAAMLQANSVALIAVAAPPGRLGRAIGSQGAAQALGLALGPTVGGLLLAVASWRWIFFVNVPAGLLGLILGWFLLPRSRDLQPRERFDWLGLGLLGPAVSCLLLVLSLGRELPLWLLLGLLGGAVVLGFGFLAHERRVPVPMLDLALFARPRFAAGIASGLLSYLVLFGVLFVTPFFLQDGLGLRADQTGFALTALPLALGLVAPVAGRVADRVGPRPPTVGGMVVAAGVLAVMAAIHDSSMTVAAGLAGIGIGLGAFIPANNAAIMASAPAGQAGMASGVLNMTRGIGTALGIAAAGMAFQIAHGLASATSSHQVAAGFTAALVMLAVAAALAAVLAGLRTRRP